MIPILIQTGSISISIYVFEKDILKMEEDGKRSIFAPGFYTMMSKDLKDKVKSMTKKDKYTN